MHGDNQSARARSCNALVFWKAPDRSRTNGSAARDWERIIRTISDVVALSFPGVRPIPIRDLDGRIALPEVPPSTSRRDFATAQKGGRNERRRLTEHCDGYRIGELPPWSRVTSTANTRPDVYG